VTKIILLVAVVVVAALLVSLIESFIKQKTTKRENGPSRLYQPLRDAEAVRMAASGSQPVVKEESPISYPYKRPLWEEPASWKDGWFVGGRVTVYLRGGLYRNPFRIDMKVQLDKSPERVRKYAYDRKGRNIAWANSDYYDDVKELISNAKDEFGVGIASGYTDYMEQVLQLLLVGALKKWNFGQILTCH